MTEIHTCSYSCERPECIRAQRDELAARMTAETSNARGDAEYEYEVWQGDALQAGGSTTDYASAQSEAGHYAMMYGQDGPVEVRIYEKRLLNSTAPSIVPVGVEDRPIDASDNAEYIEHCADRLERCGLRVTAGALRVIAHEHRALAQQPAAVGRNPAHAWPAVDRLLIDAYNAGTDGTELDLIAARRKIAALAQQPAAVDEARSGSSIMDGAVSFVEALAAQHQEPKS